MIASEHMERTVLGSCLLHPEALSDALTLDASAFSLDSHRRIFRAMSSLHAAGSHVDSANVRERLVQQKELDAIGGLGYLLSLEEGIPRNFNVEQYCKVIREKALLRDVLGIAQTIQERASDPSADPLTVLADAEAMLAEVADSSIQKGLSGIAEIAKNFQIDQEYTEGLKTHFIDFDAMTHGLQDSELIIIAARPSMGKTAFAINLAQRAAVRDDKVVAIFSLEMSKESLLRRMLAGATNRISRLERLIGTKIFIDDTPAITLQEIRAKSRRLKQQEGLDLIIIDHLLLMKAPKAENRNHEVGALSKGLKAIAKELSVPLVLLTQLNRANTQRTDKRPVLSDLRDSGSIEQDADVVAFIHREEYYDRDNIEVQGKAELIVAKQRNGPTGTVHLAFNAEHTQFENLQRA